MSRALLVAALAALAAAPDASAYEIAGRAWPEGEIRYHVLDPDLEKPVKRAAKVWNARKLSVTFVSSSEEAARVLFRGGQSNCGGAAFVGYPGRRGISLAEIDDSCGTGIAMLTAVHEFGHVLGLGHETRRCARMNATFGRGGTPGRCERHSLSYWLDHPLTKDDVRGARAIY
ncbi:MAG: M12 family metallopeptidase [Actinomycetota bacterium]|nr:M12 family metallopeptidase [Actinomycetota bacterium]